MIVAFRAMYSLLSRSERRLLLLVPRLLSWNAMHGRLLPPAEPREAGASRAVCSEAGASEQELSCNSLLRLATKQSQNPVQHSGESSRIKNRFRPCFSGGCKVSPRQINVGRVRVSYRIPEALFVDIRQRIPIVPEDVAIDNLPCNKQPG